MLKTVALAGVAAAGGLFIANKAADYMAKPETKFDDKWEPSTRALVQQGLSAGLGVGLFVLLRSTI